MAQPSQQPAESPKRRRYISPMPGSRSTFTILDNVQDELGVALWSLAADLDLWVHSASGERTLFPSGRTSFDPGIFPAELRPELAALSVIHTDPERYAPVRLASACEALWIWAERMEWPEVAIHYAELAARIEPERPDCSGTAGRLCRAGGDTHRASIWYQRAARLARVQDNQIEFAKAHLGLGNLASDLGHLEVAQGHQEKALRAAMSVGKRSLAMYAYHNLLLLKLYAENFDEAWVHAKDALSLYERDHPRLPALAHDIALLYSRMGYHSSAIPVFEAVLPTLGRVHERMLVLANVARAAAACRDRVRYDRAARELVSAIETEGVVPVGARYNLACAAHTYADWSRAERLIAGVLATCPDGEYGRLAQSLADAIQNRTPGEMDLIPQVRSEIDSVRDTLLQHLRTNALPEPEIACPEKYPLTCRTLNDGEARILEVMHDFATAGKGWKWGGVRGWMLTADLGRRGRLMPALYLPELRQKGLVKRVSVRDPESEQSWMTLQRISQKGEDALAEVARRDPPRITPARETGSDGGPLFLKRSWWRCLEVLQQHPERWLSWKEIADQIDPPRPWQDDVVPVVKREFALSRASSIPRLREYTVTPFGLRVELVDSQKTSSYVQVQLRRSLPGSSKFRIGIDRDADGDSPRAHHVPP
jgi:tetratricopeptide (TPR) repeat protein